MPSIKLVIPPRIERMVKRAAKAAFPKETFGLLIGTITGDTLHFDELHIPEDVLQYSGNTAVYPQLHWFDEAEEIARESEASIIGWVHSHPYSLKEVDGDRSLSERDMDLFQLPIAGVCTVHETKQKNGKIGLRASTRWWGPTVQVVVRAP